MPRTPLTRRTVLWGAAGLAVTGIAGGTAVAQDVVPGRLRIRRALGLGAVNGPVPAGEPGLVRAFTFHSRRRGKSVTWAMATPPDIDVEGLPVVLALHGRGSDARSIVESLSLHRFLAAHVRAGGSPFAVVAVDGDNRYWHPRADGDDPLAMIVTELLPRVSAEQHLDIRRLGVLGWSMGGYGALLLARESSARRLGRYRVRAAAAASPALFASADHTASGAFDNPADFARWGDLISDPGVAPEVDLHVSCGTDDPFAEQTTLYRHAVRPRPAGAIGPGRHDYGYWRSLLPDQFRFLAERIVN